MKIIRSIILLLVITILVGCQAAYTSIEKRDLRIEVKQQETIFTDPVPQSQKTIYLSVRNTSGNASLNIKPALIAAICQTGYKVVENPDKAHFILQVNVLNAERMSDASYQKALVSGFGTGVVTGAITGVATHNPMTGLGVGVATGVVGFVANTMVHDVYYVIVVDMEIREKGKGSVAIRGKQNLQQGSGGGTTQTYAEESRYKTYRTRIVAYANKVNLKEAEAMPPVRDRLAQVIAGSFSD
jgi:hypothetical protein